MYYLRIRPPFFVLQATIQKSMNKQDLKIFISTKKKSYFICSVKLNELQKLAVQNLNALDTTLRKGKKVPRVTVKKLKVCSRKSCLYHIIKLKTPFRSFRSQSKHLHGRLTKIAKIFVKASSEQDAAKSHDNDVLVFDSLSAILKMERREDEP